MAFLRFVLNFMVAGALVGVLATSWVYPYYTAWDNTPAVGAAPLCVCSEKARQTAQDLIAKQMFGCAAGAVAGLLLGSVFAMGRRKKVVPAGPAAPAAPKA